MNTSPHPNIWILIPAYNEARVIASVIQNLRSHNYKDILIIDDGSSDDTFQKASETGVEVLQQIINRGQGAALKVGINYLAQTIRPDIIVTFDADGQHRPQDIPTLIAPIVNDQADIVLGSRFLDQKKPMPFVRKMILKLGILFTNTLSHVQLTDTHNGLRALNRKAYTSIHITHRGMEHASDIIEEISTKKLRYTEVPVHIAYTNYSLQKGQRSSQFIKLGLKILIHKYIS